MKTESISVKKTVQIVGLLLLFRFLIGISGMFLEGISNDLEEVFRNISSIKISIIVDLITYTASVVTAVLLFPILKPYSHKLSLWFLVFSIIGFANMIQANVNVYTVTKLSQDFTANPGVNDTLFQAITLSREYDSKMNHFFSLIIHSIGALAFYLVLFREKLVPRFISVFAIVAALLVITNVTLLIFDVKSSMIVFLPNGIVQIILGMWLLWKGFSTTLSEEGKTT